jgi:glycosyltransferase involved in cell wall biosynthesis
VLQVSAAYFPIKPPKITVVIPAHNESAHLRSCLDATRAAASKLTLPVEVIIVLNRCTDDTEQIAQSYGCVVIREDAKNLSTIRNAGVAAAQGEIVITCDADSRMHPGSLVEIVRRLETGRTIGGGALVLPERWSAGIIASGFAILPYLIFTGVSYGLFWFWKRDFEAIGGFNPEFVSVEDVDFAQRLKAHGRRSKRRWGTLVRAPLITSCRKFDQFGDWYLVWNPRFVWRLFRGDDRKAADKFWYDVRS